jgi:hypothetical protein
MPAAAADNRSHPPHLLHGETRLMRRLLRASLVAGYLLVVAGAALFLYFNLWFDTWTRVEASPPPGSDYEGSFTESVLYRNEDLVARARRGSRAGLGLLGLGGVFALPAAISLARARREPGARRGRPRTD